MTRHALNQKTKTALVVSAVVAALLALSALFISPLGAEIQRGDPEAVFLEEDQYVASKIDVENTAHMLGEEFSLTLSVQYDKEYVKIDTDSLRGMIWDPFDISGPVVIDHRKVEGSVYEYSYSTNLVAIKTLPGKEYVINPSMIGYEILETEENRTFNAVPDVLFQIGSYYGGDAEDVSLRPLKPAVEDNTGLIQTLLGIAGALFILVAVSVIIKVYFIKDEPVEEEVKIPESELLLAKLSRFNDREWLEQEDARTRLRELEPLVYQAADLFFKLSPLDLHCRGRVSATWQKVIRGTESAYALNPPTYRDVENVINGLNLLLRKQDRKEGR